jgi:hypothetical protein
VSAWDAVHGWMISGPGFALGLGLTLTAPLIGWALAQALVGRAPRAGRGAAAVGDAAWGVLLLALLLRLAALGGGLPAGGPEGWLSALGAPTGGWYARDAVLLIALLHAVCFPAWAALAAWRIRGEVVQDRAVSGSTSIASFLLLAAPAGLLAAWAKLGQQQSSLIGLDLLAAAPVLLAALAVRTRAQDAVPTAPAVAPTSVDPSLPATIDVVQAWSQLGALAAQTPAFHHPAEQVAGGEASAAEAWRAAGAEGAPPVALDELVSNGDEPGLCRFVGDLPGPTERCLLTAAVHVSVSRHALRVLYLHDSHEPVGPALRSALHAGPWPLGAVMTGLHELRELLGRDLLPDVAVLTVQELSSEGLRLLADDRHGAGRRWASTIGLVVLQSVDRGSPIEVTHRAFTLRRLQLALHAAGARISLLATGFTGRGSLTLVRRAFPDVLVREVPLRPRATAGVSAWLANFHFFGAAETPWARRAAAPLFGHQHVAVSDPTGQLDLDDVAVWGADLQLSRGLSFAGPASIALLDDVWLVAAFRALPHRAPTPDTSQHHTLWGLRSDPVTRFLVRDGNLANLQRTGRLPSPQPVVGHANRALGRSHLRAASAEGSHDLGALAAAFGPSLVDELVRSTVLDGRFASRLDQDGRLIRTAMLPPSRDPVDDALRPGVTDKLVRLVDADSGSFVGEADALTAPTRFYPRRVLAWRGRRYEVPMHAHDTRRDRLELRPVAANHPLTTPRLALRVVPLEVIEALQHVQVARLAFSLGTFDAQVEESVSGVRRGREDVVQYPAVQTRYRTRVRGVFFAREASPMALHHLARSFEAALRSHLLVRDDDVEVVGAAAGWWPSLGPGLLVVDRHVQGLGVAEALDEAMVRSVFDWVFAILSRCTCQRGCSKCTPAEVLDAGAPDKEGALSLIGG